MVGDEIFAKLPIDQDIFNDQLIRTMDIIKKNVLEFLLLDEDFSVN